MIYLSVYAGAYGLPKFKNSNAFKEFSDVDQGISFLYPGAWVQRANHQRAGVYISDFDVRPASFLFSFLTLSTGMRALGPAGPRSC